MKRETLAAIAAVLILCSASLALGSERLAGPSEVHDTVVKEYIKEHDLSPEILSRALLSNLQSKAISQNLDAIDTYNNIRKLKFIGLRDDDPLPEPATEGEPEEPESLLKRIGNAASGALGIFSFVNIIGCVFNVAFCIPALVG